MDLDKIKDLINKSYKMRVIKYPDKNDRDIPERQYYSIIDSYIIGDNIWIKGIVDSKTKPVYAFAINKNDSMIYNYKNIWIFDRTGRHYIKLYK